METVNREALEGAFARLRKTCTWCRYRGSSYCRYCALGEEKRVWWEGKEEQEDGMEGQLSFADFPEVTP